MEHWCPPQQTTRHLWPTSSLAPSHHLLAWQSSLHSCPTRIRLPPIGDPPKGSVTSAAQAHGQWLLGPHYAWTPWSPSMLSSNDPWPIGIARQWADVPPRGAPDRRSPAWARSPRSLPLAYHLESLPAPWALGITFETNVDILQTTQLYVKRMSKADQVKTTWKNTHGKGLQWLSQPSPLLSPWPP